MTTFRLLGQHIKRYFSPSAPSKNVLEPLTNRTLIKVRGPEVSDFLQGLVTNDMRHLDRGPGSMYAIFLNTKGRVLYDTIIYKTNEDEAYFIECDADATVSLQKHLKIYKVRRKIDVQSADDHKINVLYNVDGNNVVMGVENNKFQDIFIFKDPRVASLGCRIISKADIDVKGHIKEAVDLSYTPNQNESYKVLRYTLGIGEGLSDLPLGNCLPLESNCDYLHGISFHKGCYIGQELTARTYHTGVIRRRLMPLLFSKIPTKLPEDNVILHENIKLGKLRGIENGVGLAQLKIKEALKFGEINVSDGIAKVVRPHWWPIEMTKEKVSVQKT